MGSGERTGVSDGVGAQREVSPPCWVPRGAQKDSGGVTPTKNFGGPWWCYPLKRAPVERPSKGGGVVQPQRVCGDSPQIAPAWAPPGETNLEAA